MEGSDQRVSRFVPAVQLWRFELDQSRLSFSESRSVRAARRVLVRTLAAPVQFLAPPSVVLSERLHVYAT